MRDGCRRDHFNHTVDADHRVGIYFGRCWKDRTDTDVIGAERACGNGLGWGVRGESDNGVRSDNGPGRKKGEVFLAEVNAVGIDFCGNFRVVVDDEPGAGAGGDRAEFFGGVFFMRNWINGTSKSTRSRVMNSYPKTGSVRMAYKPNACGIFIGDEKYSMVSGTAFF
jgi:hypothetical protein